MKLRPLALSFSLFLVAVSGVGQVVVPTTTKASLPNPSTAGTLKYVTDDVRGVWMYSAVNGSLGQQWFSLTGRMVNVEDFGATSGGGDDTYAFQSAAASMTGAVLFVPAGEYHLSQQVTITGGVVGVGAGQSIIRVLSNSSYAADTAVFGVTTSGTTFRDFAIDGNKAGNGGKRIYGIAFTGAASDAWVQRLSIKDMPAYLDDYPHVYAGDGIYVDTSVGRISLSDLRITGCMRTGVAIIAGSDIYLSRVSISAAEMMGIDVEKDRDSQVIERLFFNDVQVDSSTGPNNFRGGGISIDGLTEGSNFIRDVHMNNVTVRGSKLFGLRLISVDGALITNTNVYDSSLVGSGSFANVYVHQRSRNVVFAGCRFANVTSANASYGLSVENQASVSNVTLTGTQLGGASGTLDDPGKKTKGFVFSATATWDPPSLPPGSAAAVDITLTGAATTDACVGGLSSNTTTMILSCSVISANTVRLSLFNPQSGTIDLASGTARVDLLR